MLFCRFVVLHPHVALDVQIVIFGIAAGELLERERAVPKYLTADVTRGLNLDAHTDHLEGRPVPVTHKVADKPRFGFGIALVFRTADTRHLRNEMVSVRSAPLYFCFS